jgi:hypothetical protein
MPLARAAGILLSTNNLLLSKTFMDSHALCKFMLPESLVLTLLQASITGAGLVFAVYALIVPLSRRLFEYRAREIHDGMEELKKKVSKVGTQISQRELDEMKEVLESIDKRKDFPVYLGAGVAAIFSFYVLSTFMCVWWWLG